MEMEFEDQTIEGTEEEVAPEAAMPDQFEFAEWRLAAKGNAETMEKLVAHLEKTQVGRQLERGRALLAQHHSTGNGGQ
jgi:hypothetical protein